MNYQNSNENSSLYSRRHTLSITMCALFAALIAVCSQIQIPLPQVPINLALFAVYLAAVLLGPWYGTLSVIVFVLLGMTGVPVFAGFKGGLQVLAGPTGGYIVGYIICAWLTGMIVKWTKDTIPMLTVAMLAGMVSCYALGTVWFVIMSGYSLKASLMICVVPFLAGDVIKIALAVMLSRRLKNRLGGVFAE